MIGHGNVAWRSTGVALVLLILASLCGCIEDFPAYIGVQQGADGGQGGAGGGSDGSPADSTRPRDGGTDSVATDMATPDARQGDGGRTDADVGPEGDRGVNCTYYLAEGEICDGEDNDCDGRKDEDFVLNCCGQCGDPHETCNDRPGCEPDGGEQADAGPADAEVLPPADLGMEDQGAHCVPEVCDNQDNDCDGRTDEGVINACGRCGPDNVEICDGLDNDCDGTVDNVAGLSCNCLPGQERECYSGPQGTRGVGACVADSQICNAQGNWAACEGETLPQAEICDGIDNNCDGQVDELPHGPDGCFVGVGACQAQGRRVSDAAHGPEVACTAQPGAPRAETGDTRDNDCDGSTDEGFGLGDACQAGVGACQRQGEVVCDGPARTRCNAVSAPPGVEICDNIDNDCDGNIDEGLGLGDACEVGAGVCARPGRFACAEGEDLPICVGNPGAPGAETCNNIDDDCDGNIDEGFNLGDVCSEGVGVCARQGQIFCTPNGEAECNNPPLGLPQPEACNLADDDCDGRTDEAIDGTPCATDQLGVCAQGVVSCEGGLEECNAPLPAEQDACGNGRDDDCDGSVDNGELCNCAPGEGRSCYEGPERTDGIGICQSGVALCDGRGGLGACEGQVLPAAETCDGQDNDCDGSTDEGFGLGEACSVGQGACMRPGVMVCQDLNATRCNAVPGQPVAERCDTSDNDCDGSTDEGLLNACGVCGPVPSEICNDVDDDCDGSVDEELSCPEWTAPLGGLQITRLEVITDTQIACIANGGCPTPTFKFRNNRNCNLENPDLEGRGNHPANCMVRAHAAELCAWLGGRLPTEAEWLMFAGFAPGQNEAQPWGNLWEEDNQVACQRAQTIECLPNTTRPVGSHPNGVAPSGMEDALGSVREFTADDTPGGGVLVKGCGFGDPRSDPQGNPGSCNLRWALGRAQQAWSPDLGAGHCVRNAR